MTTSYTLHDFIEDLPPECTSNKWTSHFRDSNDFALLYPNLTSDECFTLSEQVSATHPGTYQRMNTIDYYTLLNDSRNTPL